MPLRILQSSAGSGKTFALVLHYLELVLSNPYNYRRILAITFTRKATAEMKQRIILALQQLAGGEANNFETELSGRLSEDVDIQQNAGLSLKLILNDYSNFHISTIDSFFSKLIQSVAKELGLPIGMGIDMDSGAAIKNAVNQLYQDVSRNSALENWLTRFSLHRIDQNENWKIEDQLLKSAGWLLKEEFYAFTRRPAPDNSLLTALIQEKKAFKHSFEKKLRQLGQSALGVLKEYLFETSHFVRGSLTTFVNASENKFEMNSTFEAIAQGDKKWFSKSWLSKNTPPHGLVEKLDALALEFYNFCNQNKGKYWLSTQILHNLHAFGLINHLQQAYKQYRDENNVLLISDLSPFLSAALAEDATEFIYEKTGNRIQHLLIDEFQDTSRLQWRNLLPFVTNCLAENGLVLVVGDVKQSIYRFRGGDPFIMLHQLKNDLRGFWQENTVQQLKFNWRSKKEIVAFNSLFFEEIIDLLPQGSLSNLRNAYENVHQMVGNEQGQLGGYIEINLFASEKENRKTITRWQQFSLDYMRQIIDLQLKSGYEYGDIAILVRKGSEARDVGKWLEQSGIPFTSADSVLLAANPDIKKIIALLRWIVYPESLLIKAELIRQLSPERLSSNDFIKLNEIEVERFLPASWGDLKIKLEWMSIQEFLPELMHTLNFNYCSDPYLQYFTDLISSLKSKSIYTPPAFLKWWKEHSENLMLPGTSTTNAIQLMTIHKSKGLEFPVVILPFTSFELKPSFRDTFWWQHPPEDSQSLWMFPFSWNEKLLETTAEPDASAFYESAFLDNFNGLYVALTRASDRLYINSTTDGTKAKAGNGHSSVPRLINQFLKQVSGYFSEEKLSEVHLRYTRGEIVSIEKERSNIPDDLNYLPNENLQPVILAARSSAQESEEILYGIVVHRIFENLNNESGWEATFQKVADDMKLEDRLQLTIKDNIQNLFKINQFKSWFDTDWQVMNERTIAYEGFSYRPDRVVLKDKKAIVIDFKKEVEMEDHQVQLKRYVGLIRKMGHESVEAFLVYYKTARIVRVE